MENLRNESDWKIPKSIIQKYKPYWNRNFEELTAEQLKKNGNFNIPTYYKIVEVVGRGSYGIVVAARDTRTNKMVAIKKIAKAFEHKIFAKRTLRELKILRNLKHENILDVKKILLPKSRETFQDIYLISELVEGDLYSIIKSH